MSDPRERVLRALGMAEAAARDAVASGRFERERQSRTPLFYRIPPAVRAGKVLPILSGRLPGFEHIH